jgi:hypothetical protein
MRMLARGKTMMLLYWENMRHQQENKKFSSTILVPEKCMIVALQLSTYVFSTIIVEKFLADPDPKTMAECKRRSDWNMWKEEIEAELNSLKKRKLFTNVIPTPPKIFHVGFKWVFIQKRNKNNKVVRYKVRLVAQGFT